LNHLKIHLNDLRHLQILRLTHRDNFHLPLNLHPKVLENLRVLDLKHLVLIHQLMVQDLNYHLVSTMVVQ
jgi:hypothetical protein